MVKQYMPYRDLDGHSHILVEKSRGDYVRYSDYAALEARLALADRVAVSGVRLANGGSEYVREAVIKAYAEYAKAIGRPTALEAAVKP